MIARGSECSVLSPVLNEPRVPDGPVWRTGYRVILALGLGGPQNPVLWHQAPWDGPLDACRGEPMAVGRAKWQAKMRTLGRGSMG